MYSIPLVFLKSVEYEALMFAMRGHQCQTKITQL